MAEDDASTKPSRGYGCQGAPPAQQFTRVNDAAACVAGAFYYDDNANPTTIILCPATCSTAQADPNAKIQVLLGCQGS